MATESRIAVYAAGAGNLAIAASKAVAFLMTGSTAMLTEAVHSFVDTGNQALLLFGMKRAARPPDEDHPFGHGMELYFWTFVVALMMFSLGGAASVWQGIHRVVHPEPITRPWINFLVLGVSILFEGGSFLVALRQQRRRFGHLRLTTFLKRSKDPGLFAVLLEDAAALVGLGIAAVGITVAVLTGRSEADGIASVVIGLLLVGVAGFMANETRSLLTGEAAAPRVIEAIRRTLEADPRVACVIELLSLHLGPEDILVGVTIDFDNGLSGPEVEAAAQDLTEAIQKTEARVTRVFLRPGRRVDAAGVRTPADRSEGDAPVLGHVAR